MKKVYLENLIRLIEDNLSETIDTRSLAEAGYVSHSQLYRDFYNLTGHSVKEYVRNRRLSNALALVKNSGFSLSDIAYRSGYSSQQAFCRAIRKKLDMTPLEYKERDSYYFFPPFRGSVLYPVMIANQTIPECCRVYYYHPEPNQIEERAIRAFFACFPDYDGRILGRNGKASGFLFCYELYLSDISRDYHVLRHHGFVLSGRRSACTSLLAVTTAGWHGDQISRAWDYLFKDWLQNSMFEYTNDPFYEEYVFKNGDPVKLKLLLPIRKRSADIRISIVQNPGYRFLTAKAKGLNAEKETARAVWDYISEHFSEMVREVNEYYIQKTSESFCCGIKMEHDITLSDNSTVTFERIEDGNYLMLKSNAAGDYDKYMDLILRFAEENRINADAGSIFAVYDTGQSYDNPRISMFCRFR